MNRKISATIAAGVSAAFALTAGAAGVLVATQAPAAAQQKRIKLSQNDKNFMRMAAYGNRAEIMTSQLALKKSQDPKVRKLAQMIVTEHTQALNDLKMLAQLKQFDLPQTTDKKHMAVYRRLQKLSGTQFDRQYVLAQTRDHHMSVEMFRAQMERANDTNVRSYAAKYYAPIFNHTEMVQEVAMAYKIPVAERNETDPMKANVRSTGSSSKP